MIIPLELSPDLESRLREGIARHDAASVRQVLYTAVEPAVQSLLQPAAADDTTFAKELQGLVDLVASYLGPDHTPLSDYAVSREGIYEDHD